MNECQGLFGKLFGHRFEPIYDRVPPAHIKFNGFLVFPDDQERMVEKLTKRVFKCLYCPRCGCSSSSEEKP